MSSGSVLALAVLLAANATTVDPGVGPLRLGLLEDGGPADAGLLRGAQEAVGEANADGGIAGVPVELVRLGPARPWRDGAGRVARLVFDDGVAAMIGPTDGAGAHVAAQVATRGRVPVVTLSAEMSLTRAGAPWVFRGVPGDAEQARAVLAWAFDEPRGRTAVAVVPDGREGRERMAALREACAGLGVRLTREIRVAEPGTLPVGHDGSWSEDAVLLWLDAAAARRFLSGWRDVLPATILGSLRLDEPGLLEIAQAFEIAVPRLATAADGDLAAALGYDMTTALIDAARRAGSDPAGIRDALAARPMTTGRTGAFRFDETGARQGRVDVTTLKLQPPGRGLP